MSNAVVTDVLPAWASLVSGGCVTQSGNTLTWNVGNLDASVPYVYNYCDIEVEYPWVLSRLAHKSSTIWN